MRDKAKWIGGLAEWNEGDTTYLSVAFTWKLDEAYSRALFAKACGQRVIAGGPALFLKKMRHEWKRGPFEEYQRHMRSRPETYDEQQGLFV
jgi:hypothetical protein